MAATTILVSILGALLIGAISPGPSFVLVSRISIAGSRRDGLAAALGMGLGGAFFGTLALLGLTALLSQVAWLYLGLKLLGGAYLVYLGIRIWRGAAAPLTVSTDNVEPTSMLRAFSVALVTQVSNPKTAVVYASIFAALLPAAAPLWVIAVLPPLIFLVEALWYAVVAVAFSASGPRAVYLGSKTWIDRAAGAVMGALGLRLIAETLKPQ
ncbi:LysE family translocator [Microvirga flavescens]|uniref:LysE family translocator n=1 Tax=Microvirga flavescens TaxID=2249811 RepID=UPI000DD90339|nr:LysE family transporter [Microvirga flavescens]